MKMFRSFLFTSAVLAATAGTALAQSEKDVVTGPVLRASITVNSDVVRIGDVIDNAGSAAQIAIFRAPNLGTTGSVPTSQSSVLIPATSVKYR
jgi:flagella basal body P-ring formation protein FlgA